MNSRRKRRQSVDLWLESGATLCTSRWSKTGGVRSERFEMDKKAKTPKKPKQNKAGADKKK
jgi:hypothetical protein